MIPTPNQRKNKKPSTAIIYQSPTQDIFILDIPRSLELAQHPSSSFSQDQGSKCHGHSLSLFSCAPLKAPYPNPPEPKTEKARKRVLDRIPGPERVFHDGVLSVVGDALRYLKDWGYDDDDDDNDGDGVWCFEREVDVDVDDDVERNRRKRKHEETIPSDQAQTSTSTSTSIPNALDQPPIILSPGTNHFPDLPTIHGSVVKNPSPTHPATIYLSSSEPASRISIPPNSTFLLTHLAPTPQSPIPNTSFDLLLLDPPWPNRSVRRSSHYHTTPSFSSLESLLTNLLRTHLKTNPNGHGGIAGIWTTNTHKARQTVRAAFAATQLDVCEEWIWVKCTDRGEPVVPLDGVWRRPYEVLMWGRGQRQSEKKGEVRRRVVFGVPDVHSRKPGLRELVERVFFSGLKEYTAMEVFARSLTAGWWAVGDEVLKFNHAEWWKEG